MDLEDPVALAKFLVTANIKLIRAERLGDAPDAISSDTAAGQLFEKVDQLTISAISDIQCQSELSEATGPIRATLPSNQASSGGALLGIMCV